MSSKCPWCADPNADDDVDIFTLCIPHAAEYEGITFDQFYKRDQIEYEEIMGF